MVMESTEGSGSYGSMRVTLQNIDNTGLFATWQRLCTCSNDESPGPRAGHSMVAFDKKLYVFGGFCGEGAPCPATQGEKEEHRFFNSLHVFNCELQQWNCLSPNEEQDDRPVARRHASMNEHGGSIYIFGGFSASGGVLGDMWEFKIDERVWRQIQWKFRSREPGSRPYPIARAEHTAVIYGDKLVIFGGYDGKKKLNDMYFFDLLLNEWSQPSEPKGTAPSRRCKHASVVYRDKMFVLGGFQCVQGKNFALTDLHAFDFKESSWSPVLMRGQEPRALQGHKAVVCDDSMYIIGGKTRPEVVNGTDTKSSELLQDLWQYRFDVNVWSVAPHFGEAPVPRHLHAAVAVPALENRWSIFLYGGTDKEKLEHYEDLYELENLHALVHASGDQCALCRDMKVMLNNPSFADVVFKVEGSPVYAHRCILLARSEYFRNMLQSNMREKESREIPIEEVSRPVFLAILEYIYTDRLDLENEMILEVLKAANRFGLDCLRARCEDKFSRALTVDNVSVLCQVADQHDARNLRMHCIQFIVQNFREVKETQGFQGMIRKERKSLMLDILDRAFGESQSCQCRKRPRSAD